ncbi:MAG TPA: HAD-IA family hydrolase [Pseudonocardiaceae bacterium]|jgi:sugar-phosphatase|nr:HAD-IA family hydrolase [Pseudonocardiaceae bacterium]
MDLTCAALLPDADGTLIDSIPAVERAWRTWAGEYGLDPDAVLRVCHGVRSAETVAELLPAAEFDTALARIDDLETTDTVGVTGYPSSHELLAACANGLPWAIVTSGGLALVTARLKAADLPMPSVLVTAESVTNGKPDPEGYRLAARQLGVDPRQCVVIEDAPPGIRAGKAAGATVIGVTTTHPAADLTEADVIITSLGQVSVGAGHLTISGND